MTTIINLLGEPSSGKSTLAAGLFSLMKKQYMSVELVTEYAKDLIYEGNVSKDLDQFYVFAEQHRRVSRLIGKVEYVITDSPLYLVAYYSSLGRYKDTLSQLVLSVAKEFNNVNFFVNRNHRYDVSGRSQTEEEAIAVKLGLREFLQKGGVSYKDVLAGEELPAWMFHELFNKEITNGQVK